jgi:hypothetical protein
MQPPGMGQTPTDEDAIRAQLRGQIERYMLTTGIETVPQRVLGHLAGRPQLAAEVWTNNAEAWWNHPDVDEQAWIHIREAIEAIA